jgi:dihydroorotate dehydrogenase
MGLAGALARPFLFALEPETAHRASILALKHVPIPSAPPPDPLLRVDAFGLSFPNPLGVAAGYDKGAEAPDALLRLGFGFVEAGTITPLPQPGNPRPRLFRLAADEGVINRLGFNSEGHGPPRARLLARAGRGGIVGVNIGANKDSADRAGDYVKGVEAFADVASYFTANISSPNTPGLRDLQEARALDDLLARVVEARDRVAERHGRKPLLVKIAPDLIEAQIDDIVRVAVERKIDGLIVSNTTVTRPGSLREKSLAREAGGLSGRPVFDLSTRVLAQVFTRVEGRFPLIGAGGIDGPATARAKIEAGAALLQFYSSMVFKGPGLPRTIARGLAAHVRAAGLPGVGALTGANARDWAAGKGVIAPAAG